LITTETEFGSCQIFVRSDVTPCPSCLSQAETFLIFMYSNNQTTTALKKLRSMPPLNRLHTEYLRFQTLP